MLGDSSRVAVSTTLACQPLHVSQSPAVTDVSAQSQRSGNMTGRSAQASPQVSTPSSTAPTNGASNGDGSINKSSKDKACPFCHQPFTSSSLGRHLDLYIKPKNPKPADGIHDVEKIKAMRGGITRRQPRNSLRPKQEGESDHGTPMSASMSWDREESVRATDHKISHPAKRVTIDERDGSMLSPNNRRQGMGTVFNAANCR